jgi:ribonuclease P protein component
VPSLKFGKVQRLARPAEFLRVKEEGQAHRGRLMILGVLPCADEQRFRTGFVTSKRVGGAVVRNRVRRRMREIVRRYQHAVRGGMWLVLIARPPAARASYQQIEDEWLLLARRASLLVD